MLMCWKPVGVRGQRKVGNPWSSDTDLWQGDIKNVNLKTEYNY